MRKYDRHMIILELSQHDNMGQLPTKVVAVHTGSTVYVNTRYEEYTQDLPYA